jgi:DNA-binding protein HU-beta
MATERMSFDEYRSLSDEEREIVRAEAAVEWLRERERKPSRDDAAAGRTMTKAQLVATLAGQLGIDKKLAGAALDSLAGIVATEVAAGGSVTLPGLGKFAARTRPERAVRKPATGARVAKADAVVEVTVAKELRNAVGG